MKNVKNLLFFSALFISYISISQTFYTELYNPNVHYNVKQFGEFCERFNYEKDPFGNGRDTLIKYISRADYLEYLFRKQLFVNDNLLKLKTEFIQDVCSNNYFINLKNTDIVVNTPVKLSFNSKNYQIQLFLKKNFDNNVVQWYIYNVQLDSLRDVLLSSQSSFIPPNDNELEFLQLSKLLNSKVDVSDLIDPENLSDISLFIAYMNKSAFSNFTISSSYSYIVRITEKWTVYIRNFNELGANSGWLIYDLKKHSK